MVHNFRSPPRIGRITPAGVTTANGSPLDITTGPDGNVWFTEADGNLWFTERTATGSAGSASHPR